MIDERHRRILGFDKSMLLKLDQNESPFLPPEHILDAAKDALKTVNFYQTDYIYDEVCRLYGEYCGIEPDRIVIAPGADNFFDSYLYHFRVNSVIAAPRPTYFLFEEQVSHAGYRLVGSRLSPPLFTLDVDDFSRYMGDADFIYIDNPNNPTGSLLVNREKFIELLEDTDKPFLIDEAYYEFTDNLTFADLVYDYPNIGVLRTMSKAFCLAGLRLTILILGDDISKIFYKKIIKFRVPTPSLAIAKAALSDWNYIRDVVKNVVSERIRLSGELRKIGLEVYNSYTNFILVRSDVDDLVSRLKGRGIFVKDVSNQLGRGYIRITIGDRVSNNLLINAIRDIIG